MNLNELNEMLKDGWPLDTKLINLPFGSELIKIKGDHVVLVLDAVNALLSPDFRDNESVLLRRLLNSSDVEAQRECVEAFGIFYSACEDEYSVKHIFNSSPMGMDKITKIIRTAALYHDIGKTIRRARHASAGFQIIAHIDEEKTEQIKSMLAEDGFSLFCNLVRYHDLFGVVGTGEASAAVLVDIMPFRSTPDYIIEQQTLLAALLLLNIADISGTINLTCHKVGTLVSEWKRLNSFISGCEGHRQKFADSVITDEQREERAIERIRRLILERYPGNRRLEPDFMRKIDDAIERALRVPLGPPIHEFAREFALVCKFDYMLKFVEQLERDFGSDYEEIVGIVEIIVPLIKTLVQGYSDLTRRSDGTHRRIAIELFEWGREQVSESLIRLLRKNLLSGLEWALEDATAWYFE